jgi:LPS export ABC transporter protein LptC
MRRLLLIIVVIALLGFSSCQKETEHVAPAIYDRDSVSMMVSYGVNTLISDSGVIKYRIVTERWDVNTVKSVPRWTFEKGIFLEQFDEKFHVGACITADTAWYYDQKRLWELRGRVFVRNNAGAVFRSEELFWDQNKHILYSNKFSRITTSERHLQGTRFESDEYMTSYTVTNSKGSLPAGDLSGESTPASTPGDTATAAPPVRPAATPTAAKPKLPAQPKQPVQPKSAHP